MSGSTLFSIGEALIDMIPSRAGCSFDEVPSRPKMFCDTYLKNCFVRFIQVPFHGIFYAYRHILAHPKMQVNTKTPCTTEINFCNLTRS